MKNSFLPQEYTVPVVQSRWLSFPEGETKIRVLSEAIVGYLYWLDESGNPLASPAKNCQTVYISSPDDLKDDIKKSPDLNLKHFWIMSVWEYNAQQVKLAKITQNSVMKDIERYVNHPQWGDPRDYDLVVTRNGVGKKTTYQVTVLPKSPLDEGITRFYQDLSVDLYALFKGENPIQSEDKRSEPPQPSGVTVDGKPQPPFQSGNERPQPQPQPPQPNSTTVNAVNQVSGS